MVRRIALGFAVAAFVAPAAQASLDQGGASSGSQVKVNAADYGMPRAMPSDYALSSGDQIEVVRAQPRGTSSDMIEFVRTQPRAFGEPQVASRFARPNSTTTTSLEAVNWQDFGVGIGLVLGLVLLGGGAALATRHQGKAQTA